MGHYPGGRQMKCTISVPAGAILVAILFTSPSPAPATLSAFAAVH
jgi:hypothetical protein